MYSYRRLYAFIVYIIHSAYSATLILFGFVALIVQITNPFLYNFLHYFPISRFRAQPPNTRSLYRRLWRQCAILMYTVGHFLRLSLESRAVFRNLALLLPWGEQSNQLRVLVLKQHYPFQRDLITLITSKRKQLRKAVWSFTQTRSKIIKKKRQFDEYTLFSPQVRDQGFYLHT